MTMDIFSNDTVCNKTDLLYNKQWYTSMKTIDGTENAKKI